MHEKQYVCIKTKTKTNIMKIQKIQKMQEVKMFKSSLQTWGHCLKTPMGVNTNIIFK